MRTSRPSTFSPDGSVTVTVTARGFGAGPLPGGVCPGPAGAAPRAACPEPLRDFPGRFTNGQLWVEALPAETEEDTNRPARAGDGVSSILITSNDLAGAWAMRPDGQPMLPLVPGEPRQREFAFRSGVNIVMYALTGNYKADQVHIPALLERLGQ